MYSSTFTITSLSLLVGLHTAAADYCTGTQNTVSFNNGVAQGPNGCTVSNNGNDPRASYSSGVTTRIVASGGGSSGSGSDIIGSAITGDAGGTTIMVSNNGDGNGITVVNGKTLGPTAAATTGAGAAQTSSTKNHAPKQTAGIMGAAAVAVGAAMVL